MSQTFTKEEWELIWSWASTKAHEYKQCKAAKSLIDKYDNIAVKALAMWEQAK